MAGIIREVDGPWCALVTLGMKKNGKYRFCVAYIGLNAQTERESWPLPNIEEVLDGLEDLNIIRRWTVSVGSTLFLSREMINISLPFALLGEHSAIQ